MRQVVCAVMQNDRGMFLAAQRAYGSMAGKWEFPGGKLEVGETPQQACERELFEELGIRVKAAETIFSNHIEVGSDSFKLLFVRAEWLSGEMSPAEHKELRWVCHNELHSLDWLEGDIPMVKWLQARSSPLDQERPQRLKNQKKPEK